MRRDALKDPATDADAARARLLVDQVLLLILLTYCIWPHETDKMKV